MTAPNSLSSLLRATIMVLLSVISATNTYAATKAGEVVTVSGRTVAATQDGNIRKLEHGGAVNAGDTVVTSSHSYVRIKFIDGASVILRPNSRFFIENYQLAEKAEESRSSFNLIKGGFRAVTGLIGKHNPGGYRVRTAVATIGIRGTDYSVVTCQGGSCPDNPAGDYYQVHDGSISVVTEGGELIFQSGDFGYVSDPNGPPVNIPEADAEPITDDPLPPTACE